MLMLTRWRSPGRGLTVIAFLTPRLIPGTVAERMIGALVARWPHRRPGMEAAQQATPS